MKKELLKLLATLCVMTSMITTSIPAFAAESPGTSTTQSTSIDYTDENAVTADWAAANGWKYVDYHEYEKTVDNITYTLMYTWTFWEQHLGINNFNPHWFIFVSDGSNVTGTVTIPGSIDGFPVLSIDRDAFNLNEEVTEVIIEEGVQEISELAFSYADKLSKVSLPDSMLFLDGSAFYYCDALTNLTVPASVQGVAWNIVMASAMESITFEGNAPEVLYANGEKYLYVDAANEHSLPIYVYEGTTGWDDWKNPIHVIKSDKPVIIPATGVTVDQTSVSIKEGETVAITATVSPSNATDKTVTWNSENTDIATVDNGTITGVKAGTTTITASCGNVSASVAVTVNSSVELPYTDVTTEEWYYNTVADVYAKGLMTGMNATTFAPRETLARAQFATILYRMGDEPEIAYKATFKDVADDEWYTDAVLWASDYGVVTGYSNGNFGPADKINREQMATMMFRYANAKGLDTSQRTDLSSYPDAGSVSPFAKDAISWCVANGIISGDNGKLNPQGETARAVCATIISRFYEAYDL